MSDAISGTGILLLAGDGATPTETFTAIAELTEVKLPQLSRKQIDVTPHNTARTLGSQEILGMLKKGLVTIVANWIPTDATHRNASGGLLHDMLNNVKRNWQIQIPPDGYPEWTFPGRVQLFDPESVKVDSELSFKAALAIDGEIEIVEES